MPCSTSPCRPICQSNNYFDMDMKLIYPNKDKQTGYEHAGLCQPWQCSYGVLTYGQ